MHLHRIIFARVGAEGLERCREIPREPLRGSMGTRPRDGVSLAPGVQLRAQPAHRASSPARIAMREMERANQGRSGSHGEFASRSKTGQCLRGAVRAEWRRQSWKPWDWQLVRVYPLGDPDAVAAASDPIADASPSVSRRTASSASISRARSAAQFSRTRRLVRRAPQSNRPRSLSP